MMKKIYLFLFITMFLTSFGWGQGNETFDNAPNTSSSYTNSTFTGQDGSTWTMTQCRTDQTITGKACMMGKDRTPIAYIESGSISGGIGNLTFNYKRAFSTNANFEVYINGTLKGTFTTSDANVQIGSISSINVTGSIVIKFLQKTGGGQINIDDVVWTAYSAGPADPEPTNQISSFSAAAAGSSAIDLTWSDNDGAQAASGILILVNETGTFSDPVDGTAQADDTDLSDGSGVYNAAHGDLAYTFSGLTSSTQYYFKAFTFTNSGSDIDYKTDGTVPTANATTASAPKVFISQVTDPGDEADAKYVEIFNNGTTDVDLTGWQIRRYANGSTSYSDANLSGTLYSGTTFVISYSTTTFPSNYGFDSDQNEGGVITGNGDDVYELYDGSGTVDIYGEIGVDGSGKDWEYTNSKAIRNTTVTSANATWTSSEWTITSADVADMTPGTYKDCITWSGVSSEIWATTTNWSGGSAPDATKNVKIPFGPANYPTILAAANCKDLIMKSNDSKDPSLIGQVNLTLAGEAIIERYISKYTTEENGWHFLSSPVQNLTIATSDFVPGAGIDDLYEFDESANSWLNYIGGTFGDSQFDEGKGYLVAYVAEDNKAFRGDLNSSSETENLTYNVGAGDGWNLIGNPFPSAIDATALTFTGSVGNAIYVVDPNGTYLAHNGTFGHPALADGEIPIAQGFFVKATGAGASVTMEAADQVHSTNTFNKNQGIPDESLIVSLVGQESENSTYFQFRDDASVEFDGQADAYKLFGWATIPQIYSELNDVQYSINCLPHSEETITVPLGISLQVDEELSLNFSGMETFFNSVKIELEDKQLGFTQNIANNPIYTFEASTQDDPNRFLLHFNGVTGVEDAMETQNIQVYSVENSIYVSSQESLDAEILVYNINGQVLYQDHMNAETLKKIDLKASSGVYLVNVISEETTSTQKVYIK